MLLYAILCEIVIFTKTECLLSFYKALTLFAIICFSNATFSQNIPPTIVAESETFYCPLSRQNIVTSFNITDPDDTQVEAFFIQISLGYNEGEDFLELTNTHPEITAIWNSTEGRLTLESANGGLVDYTTIIAAVNDVVFFNTNPNNTTGKTFSYTIGDANFLPSTGHFYQFIPDMGISWTDAEVAAANLTFFGLQGYLATLTSAEEAQFAGNQITGNGWIGGSDAQEEGVWRWVTGPEAGLIFWNGAANGSTPNFANWNTGEPNQSGNEDYAHITAPGIGIDGSWNDLRNEGDPSGPFRSMGYVVEYGGLPGDPDVNISTSTSFQIPRITSISENINLCGPSQVSLTAQVEGDTVLWFASETSTAILNTGVPFNVMVPNTTTFWALASVDGCTTGLRTPVTITINELPVANDSSLTQCDTDGISDGLTLFNLNEANAQLTNGIAGLTTQFFSSFANAQNTVDPIDGAVFENTQNPQTLYVQVIDERTSCFSIAELVLEVSVTTANNAIIEVCDIDGVEDGFHLFSLDSANGQVLDGLPNSGVDFDVMYYESIEEALLEENPLANEYINSVPNNQIIYARVENNNNCFGISEVQLIVNRGPELLEPERTVIYCLNTFPERITLESSIVSNEPITNFTFNWSTGEMTPSIQVNETGTFTVEITGTNNCSSIQTIIVLPSEIASIDEILVNGINSNNTVEVNVSGEGDYEFALDSPGGPFQTDNTFIGVSPGFHTVYVNDRNGCGIVSELFSVVGFPNFFTPNGDSFNDTWQVIGVNEDFNENSFILIFNRFGQLITQIRPNDEGWDGTFNGRNLPESDYWFRAQLEDGRVFTGHFSLVR